MTAMTSSAKLGVVSALGILVVAGEAWAIPPFARKYGTSCQTCHVMIPKLNSFGEAVRLNGYQIPHAEEMLVKDQPLQLGAEPWKQMWPDAMWPSNIPGMPPIGFRVINDIQFTREKDSNFEFPHEFEILAGGRFGESVGFFAEVEWHQGSVDKGTVGGSSVVTGVDGTAAVKQAYFVVNDLLKWTGIDAPEESLNLRIGLLDTQFLLAHNNTTRVGKNHPLWGNKKPSDVTIAGLKSKNGFRLQNNQPAIELYSILGGGRLYLAAGVATGAGESRFDNNNHKDLYYRVKYKLSGRDFLGRVGDEEVTTETKPTGGWVDNALLLEHFGYFGEGTVAGGLSDEFRYFGGAIRWTVEDLDLSAGVVFGKHDRPFGTDSTADLESLTWFAKAEYMFYPWLMGRLVYEKLDFEAGSPLSTDRSSQDQERILVGPVFAPLANMRIVIEWEQYLDHEKTPNPDTLWIRMDWAF